MILPHPAIHYIQELIRVRFQVNKDELVQSSLFNQSILLSFKLCVIQPEKVFGKIYPFRFPELPFRRLYLLQERYGFLRDSPYQIQKRLCCIAITMRCEPVTVEVLRGVFQKRNQVLQWLEKAIKEGHNEEINYNTVKREEFSRIIRTADLRIENAYRDKLDGKMPAPLCEKMISESTKEKEDAIEALGRLSKGRTAYYEAGYAIHELASKATAIYKSPRATEDEKRLLLSHIFSNLTLKADRISPNYTYGFEFLAEWVPKLNLIFELAKDSPTKGKEDAFASSHPVLLRLLNTIRTSIQEDKESKFYYFGLKKFMEQTA